MSISRRDFLATAIAGSASLGLGTTAHAESIQGEGHERRAAKLPVIISAHNGYNYLDAGYAFLAGGGDTLDAALKVVQGPENDPNDESVGLGGHPNEDGVVELDACCMHGPTRTAGSVGGIRNIKNASLVSNAVRLHTGHVMLVGEGAERFAVAQGFPRENLLTDKSRKEWLLWKETHSDWWGPGLDSPDWKRRYSGPTHADEWQLRIERMQEIAADIGIAPEHRAEAIRYVIFPPTGTIHCSALNEKSAISGCTTTSGLAWKIPGRVGDSPIIGAGCYTDQDVGSAGATGNGEENIKIVGAHTIVENMRHGMSPLDAGMDALKRIVRNYNGEKERLQFVDMVYYILRKDGAYAGVSLWDGYESSTPHQIAVHDGTRRLENTVSMFKGASQSWPPLRMLH
ncbi:MAG TPA: N(4)-(beta-N-acetylglucosaminyl)-L-asparaginase [Terriglobales bacterium]|nr:N(4)-(beta-N-acetylglucosaminyl)-L-asparaginase [Terriglobales bacterium]